MWAVLTVSFSAHYCSTISHRFCNKDLTTSINIVSKPNSWYDNLGNTSRQLSLAPHPTYHIKLQCRKTCSGTIRSKRAQPYAQ